MVQNDEDKDDVLKQTVETKKKVEKTIKPEGHEAEVKTAVSRKLISAATLKKVGKQIKEFSINTLNNPHGKEAVKLQTYNLALAGLAVAEFIPVPGVEDADDLTKILAIAQKAVKKGKEKGFFDKLYKDIPPGLLTFAEGIDLVDILPGDIVSIIPEIVQSTINQFKIYKESFLFGKDMIKDAYVRVKNFAQPSAEVQAARLQFAPKMA
jgi:hypothetical protein